MPREITVEQLEQAKESGAPVEDVAAVMKTEKQREMVASVYTTKESPLDLTPKQSTLTMEELAIEPTEAEKGVPSRAATDEAAYAASLQRDLSGMIDVVGNYRKIRNDLELTGTSPELDSLRQLLGQEEVSVRRDAIYNIMASKEIDEQTKQAVLANYLEQKAPDISLKEEYITSVMSAREEEQAASLAIDISFIQDRLNWQEEKQQLVNAEVVKFDASIASDLAGFAEVLLPFAEGGIVQHLQQVVTDNNDGVATDAWNTVWFGSNKEAIRTALEKMPFEERKEATKKLISAIGNLPGYDMKKMYLFQSLVENGEYAAWEKYLDNIIGVLDTTIVLAPITKAAGSLVRGSLKAHPNSVLKNTELADAVKASDTAAAGLADETGELADALGVTKPEIAMEYGLPKLPDEVVDELGPDIYHSLNAIENTYKDVQGMVETAGINYQREEKLAAANRLTESMKDVDGLSMHVNKSVLENDGERFFGVALYGKTEKGGFGYAKDALERAKANGIADEDLILYNKNHKTGQLVEVEDLATTTRGSYYVGKKFDHVYNQQDAAIFGSDTVSTVGKMKMGGYLADVTARFSNWFSDALLRSHDVGSAVEKRLLDVVRQDIGKLNRTSQIKLFDALEAGAVEVKADGSVGKVYTRSELATKFKMNEKEIRAYYSYRKVSDIMWSMTNRTYRRKLEGEGYKAVQGLESEVGRAFAKPMEASQVKLGQVYDPATGKMVHVDADTLATMYAEGKQVGRLSDRIKVGDEYATQVIVDGKVTKFNTLPENPLPYIDGYYQRTYKEYYFVDKIPKELVVDGIKITDPKELEKYASTVAAGDSPKKLESIRSGLAGKDDATYVVRRARELDDHSVREHQMRMGYLKSSKGRGDHIQGFADEGLANIEDPMEALFRSVRTMSGYVSKEDLISSAQQRWVNTFGKATGGKYPNSIDEIATSALSADELASAKAIFNQLNMLHRLPAKSDTVWQNFILDVAEFLDGKSLKAGDMTRKMAEVSPTALARKLPSTLFIALRPLRQLIVQSGQLMQLAALSPKYMASGQFVRETLALLMARAAWSHPEHVSKMAKVGAKLFGVSEKEYKVIVDNYMNKSGLPYSVDSNVFVEGVVNDIHARTTRSPLAHAVHASMRPITKTIEISKQVGFDVGELTNLTGTWAFARRRWIDNNPEIAHKWAEKQYSDVIAAEARKISYAMTQPGTFDYQRGLLSVPLQFMSVPHKAFLSVLPEAYGGSKTFTSAEKGRVFATNIALFGGAGLGMSSAVDAILESAEADLPEETLLAVKGGFVDLSFNLLLRTMSEEGDGTAIKFSDSWAPFAEKMLPGVDLLSNLLDGEVSAMFGPVSHIVGHENSRFAKVINDWKYLYEAADISTEAKLLRGLVSVGQLASGLSDYTKYDIAMRSGMLVSSRGSDIVEATRNEAVAKLFGLMTYSEEAVWKASKNIGDRQSELKKEAKALHESLMRMRNTYGTDNPEYIQLLRNISNINSFRSNPDDALFISKEMARLDRLSARSVNDSLALRAIKWAGNGAETRREVVSVIQNTNLPQTRKDLIVDYLELSGGEE